MGRSSTEQALQNRAQIVKSASRLFREHGVEGVSIGQIMASAGMTIGGFYKHFESKDALVQEACALSFSQAMKSWLAVVAQSDGKADSKAAAIVRHYFTPRPPYQTCPMLAYAPEVSADDTSDATRHTYSRGAQDLFELFARQAAAPDEAKKPHAAPVRDAAVMFAAMVGAQLLAQATNGSQWSRSLLEAVTQRAARM